MHEPVDAQVASQLGDFGTADALRKGAKVLTSGKRAAQGGTFFEPTVLTHLTTDIEEVDLGPVVSLYRFKTHGEVISRACFPRPSATRGARPTESSSYSEDRTL